MLDACFAGASLIKNASPIPVIQKEGLRSVIQFSSSLDNQTSLGGEKLSEFTKAFVDASMRKTEGPIYYSDIRNTIRDNFIGNESQTPFFVDQGTGRDLFVDDASKLEKFREHYRKDWLQTDGTVPEDGDEISAEGVSGVGRIRLILEKLENKAAEPAKVETLIGSIFDGVEKEVENHGFSDFFKVEKRSYNFFAEESPKELMIRVLSKEERPDRLVTAELKKSKKKPMPFDRMAGLIASLYDEWEEHYDLELNCTLPRVQLKIELTPTYSSLEKIDLILTCAPSLHHCYVFELTTVHPRTDWNHFSKQGREVVRRWYKIGWGDQTDSLIQKIVKGLDDAVAEHLSETTKQLDGG